MKDHLDEAEGWIWLNGSWVAGNQAKIHILTHTLHYGSGVFDGERAVNSRIFKMVEHHQRLHQSAEMLDFKIPYTVDELNIAALEVLAKNGLKDAYVRPIAWHGAEHLGLASTHNSINVAIAAWEWPSYFGVGNVSGISLMWADWIRSSPNMAPVHAKATGLYLTGGLAINKAIKLGYQDALMLDYRGFVAECTAANVFMVKGGVLLTPIPDCFLNGITRQTVIEIAHAHNIPFMERHILPSEIMAADEVFITGTAVGIQGVSQIGEHKFSVGSMTSFIRNQYHSMMEQ